MYKWRIQSFKDKITSPEAVEYVPATHKTQESELADPANRESDQRLEVNNPNNTILIGLQNYYIVELLLSAAMVSRAQDKRD